MICLSYILIEGLNIYKLLKKKLYSNSLPIKRTPFCPLCRKGNNSRFFSRCLCRGPLIEYGFDKQKLY